MSIQQAINDKCRDCIYDECLKVTWREQVSNCTVTSCPLWKHRPTIQSPISKTTLTLNSKHKNSVSRQKTKTVNSLLGLSHG